MKIEMLYMLVGGFFFVAFGISQLIFHIPVKYKEIDHKYLIKRSGWWFYVVEFNNGIKKKRFKCMEDCMTYIKEKEKGEI